MLHRPSHLLLVVELDEARALHLLQRVEEHVVAFAVDVLAEVDVARLRERHDRLDRVFDEVVLDHERELGLVVRESSDRLPDPGLVFHRCPRSSVLRHGLSRASVLCAGDEGFESLRSTVPTQDCE